MALFSILCPGDKMRNWPYLGFGPKITKVRPHSFLELKSLRKEIDLILMFSGSYPEIWPLSQFLCPGDKMRN